MLMELDLLRQKMDAAFGDDKDSETYIPLTGDEYRGLLAAIGQAETVSTYCQRLLVCIHMASRRHRPADFLMPAVEPGVPYAQLIEVAEGLQREMYPEEPVK